MHELCNYVCIKALIICQVSPLTLLPCSSIKFYFSIVMSALHICVQAPLEDDRNGIILGYNIYYRPSPPGNFTNASAGVYLQNGSNITVANYSLAVHTPRNNYVTTELYTLRGLEEDTSYDFYMEAFNSVGVGPSTTIYTVTTDEGK